VPLAIAGYVFVVLSPRWLEVREFLETARPGARSPGYPTASG